METVTTSTHGSTALNTQQSDPGFQKTAALSSDFETFLKMLTVQMKNQDPLNPVDSADYAVQLATFSSVEQQVLTNDILASLASSMSGGGIGSIGQWVGMDVRTGNTAFFEGHEIELTVAENSNADQRILVVHDDTGGITTRINLPTSGTSVSWDGELANGSIAAHGKYTFSVENFQNGALLATEEASPYNRVHEAIIDNGQISLVLNGGIVTAPNDVTALRSPT